MDKRIEQLLPLVDNILPETDVPYRDYILEAISNAKGNSADELVEFLNRLLKLSALYRVSSLSYLDIFFENRLVVPSKGSYKLKRAVRLLVATLINTGHNRVSWFAVGGDVPHVILSRSDETSVWLCNYLYDTLEDDLIELLAWSLQWVTVDYISIPPLGDKYMDFREQWTAFIDENRSKVEQKLKELQSIYPNRFDLDLKYRAISGVVGFYSLRCSVSKTTQTRC